MKRAAVFCAAAQQLLYNFLNMPISILGSPDGLASLHFALNFHGAPFLKF
jgi:hypothetical protein